MSGVPLVSLKTSPKRCSEKESHLLGKNNIYKEHTSNFLGGTHLMSSTGIWFLRNRNHRNFSPLSTHIDRFMQSRWPPSHIVFRAAGLSRWQSTQSDICESFDLGTPFSGLKGKPKDNSIPMRVPQLDFMTSSTCPLTGNRNTWPVSLLLGGKSSSHPVRADFLLQSTSRLVRYLLKWLPRLKR